MSFDLREHKLPVHYSGKFQGSFAYLTIKDRLPVILVKVVDSLCQCKTAIGTLYGEAAKEEIKEIIGRLSGLQNEMVTNKPLKPLVCNSSGTNDWNEYLEKQKVLYDFTPSWFDSSWLYVECYLYRRMKEAFELSSALKDYDYFQKQKQDSFLLSIDVVSLLCLELNHALKNLQELNQKTDLHNYFRQFLEVSLWGNKCDLSISAGKENIKQCNPFSQLDELRKNILVENTDDVWRILQEAKNIPKEIQIDFILDNAGFELFCDFCLLHFLQSTKLVNKVRIHVKMMPWFVSDTLENDIKWLLETMSQSSQENLAKCGKEWTDKFKTGEWIIENEKFWTLPHDYSEMQLHDPNLYQKLSKSDLVIFKGDLNYRKLTGDRKWPESTSFCTALNRFLPTSLVTLRTIKADVIVGLGPGTSEHLNQISENWKFTGKYALIQCEKCVTKQKN